MQDQDEVMERSWAWTATCIEHVVSNIPEGRAIDSYSPSELLSCLEPAESRNP
jgi:hypothetical protein